MPCHQMSAGLPRLAGGLGVALLAWVLALGAALAQDLLPVPALSARVIDQTATLTEPQRRVLETRLETLERETGAQLVVLIVASTQPEDIAAYTQRAGDAWKLGRPDVGDGLLLVVAKNDRRVRIAVAKTLEGAIPDLMAARIIDERITPAFRAGDFAGGLNGAVDALALLVKGEDLPPPAGSANARDGLQLDELLMFFFVGVPVVGGLFTAVLGRRLGALATAGAAGGIGWWLTASLLAAGAAGLLALVLVGVMGVGVARRGGGGPVIWGSGGGGGGWGGAGGGGFRSGGGGDFGGGGASGRW